VSNISPSALLTDHAFDHRILDPILYDLLDPAILRTPTQAKVHGKEIQGFIYERPFDQRYVHYLLQLLLSVVRFGGQSFVKTAKISYIRRSLHAGLVNRVDYSECNTCTW
jgi:hypothetical protein